MTKRIKTAYNLFPAQLRSANFFVQMASLLLCCWGQAEAADPSTAFRFPDLRLTELATGQRKSLRQILAADRTVIVVEKGCVPCKAYLKGLQACPVAVRDRIDFLSTSSARQTRSLKNNWPLESGLYLMAPGDARMISAATPTTIRLGKSGELVKFVGERGCTDLAEWMGVSL